MLGSLDLSVYFVSLFVSASTFFFWRGLKIVSWFCRVGSSNTATATKTTTTNKQTKKNKQRQHTHLCSKNSCVLSFCSHTNASFIQLQSLTHSLTHSHTHTHTHTHNHTHTSIQILMFSQAPFVLELTKSTSTAEAVRNRLVVPENCDIPSSVRHVYISPQDGGRFPQTLERSTALVCPCLPFATPLCHRTKRDHPERRALHTTAWTRCNCASTTCSVLLLLATAEGAKMRRQRCPAQVGESHPRRAAQD